MLKLYLKKSTLNPIMSEEKVKLCFLVTFNVIISYIMKISWKFIKSLRRYEFLLLRFELFFLNFWIVLSLLATKKLMMSASVI